MNFVQSAKTPKGIQGIIQLNTTLTKSGSKNVFAYPDHGIIKERKIHLLKTFNSVSILKPEKLRCKHYNIYK